jgi:hypothetical protein
MKLFYPKSHYKPERLLVFPLLRPFIKDEDFTDEQRIELYGVSESDFEFTSNLEDADLVILTMAWNFYVKKEQTAIAQEFIINSNALVKKVLAVNTGDFGMPIPYFENLIVFRSSGYKSKFHKNEFALPSFIRDPLSTYFNSMDVIERPYLSKPVIGFCGHANPSRINAAKEVIRTVMRNIKFHLGLTNNEPQDILSATYLRFKILNQLQKSTFVTCNFIYRKKYRAGIKYNKDDHRTSLEFYENLLNSDYIVCVRGAGNFSIRFYEALAMGRIPIFINTDSPLPFDGIIDWKKHVIWVEYADRLKVAEKVADFHQGLSETDYLELQHSNRKLWEDRLTLKGFFKNFIHKEEIL